MTTASVNVLDDTASIDSAAEDRRHTDCRAASEQRADLLLETRFRRLAKGLLDVAVSSQPRAVSILEVQHTPGSSLWMTVGIAAALGALAGKSVHVLSLGTEERPKTPLTHHRNYCEPIPLIETFSPAEEDLASLEDRAEKLLSSGRPVLMHAPDAAAWAKIAIDPELHAGVVLITHASKTRKNTLQCLQLRLRQLGLPVLGAVLLDRQYPIPASIYRLL